MGIPQHQKGYLVYVPITRKVISSYDVVFDKSFSSALSYSSRLYAEAMTMRPAVTYTPYATSSKEQTGDVITFAQFVPYMTWRTECTSLPDALSSLQHTVVTSMTVH